MTNPFYTRTFDVLPGTVISSQAIENQFQSVEAGFDGVKTAVDSKDTAIALKATKAGDTYTGTHDFSGATAVQVPGTPLAATAAASKSYVDAQLAAAAAAGAAGQLPNQTGNAGKFLTTSGSVASWGDAGSLIRSGRTSNTQLTTTDKTKIIDITSGTFTQTFDAAATLGSGWFCYIRNNGAGDITLDPNASETIDGVTSFVMYPGEVRLVQCDGTGFNSIVLVSFYKTFTASGTFTTPPGYSQIAGLLWSGGGAGRKSAASTITIGGHGGGCFPFSLPSSSLGASQSVTIGAGGVGPSTANTAGPAGGDSSLGSLITVKGAGSTDQTWGGSVTVNSVIVSWGGTVSDGFGTVALNATSTTQTVYGGATASNNSAGATNPSGCSLYGGAGGGSITNATTTCPAGTSNFGGNGGAASLASSGSNGVAPAGGGGATQTGTKAGDGARGELRIWGVL